MNSKVYNTEVIMTLWQLTACSCMWYDGGSMGEAIDADGQWVELVLMYSSQSHF